MALALALALFGGPTYGQPDNVHAAVFQWAAQHPGENVPVIVRSNGKSAQDFVSAVGGQVKQDLPLISSVEAQVPATSLRALAGSSDVEYISLDAPVQTLDDKVVDAGKVVSEFSQAVHAQEVWGKNDYGQGVGVAVVDTGVSPATNPDFVGTTTSNTATRIVASVAVDSSASTTNDGYGHGTHIAGIIGGDGNLAGGKYVGVAPRANLINVKISNDLGASSMGDLIAGLQWVYNNRTQYNIRVVNLSLHSSIAESYTTSPVDAAVEFLWQNGIFVVVASGNTGQMAGSVNFPPANDPFVMTVGAIDDKGTDKDGDDTLASFSSAGTTQDGFIKPELLTPGVGIVSDTNTTSILYGQGLLAGKVISPGPYLKLSGTSMAAGVMSGIGALVYEKHPDWTPGQMKCSLIAKSRKLAPAPGSPPPPPGSSNLGNAVAKAIDTYNLAAPACNSDTGIQPSKGLLGTPIVPLVGAVAYVLSQPDPYASAAAVGIDLTAANVMTTSPNDPTVALSIDTVDWSAIKWEAIAWESVKWDQIDFTSVKWDSIKWDVIKWDSIKWDSIKWDSIKWDLINWQSIKWDSVKWAAINWQAINWQSIKWDVVKWSSVESTTQFDSIKWDASTLGFDAIMDN